VVRQRLLMALLDVVFNLAFGYGFGLVRPVQSSRAKPSSAATFRRMERDFHSPSELSAGLLPGMRVPPCRCPQYWGRDAARHHSSFHLCSIRSGAPAQRHRPFQNPCTYPHGCRVVIGKAGMCLSQCGIGPWQRQK